MLPSRSWIMYWHVIFLVTAMYFSCTPFPIKVSTGVVTHSCPWYVFLCASKKSKYSIEEWNIYPFHHFLFLVTNFWSPIHQMLFFILFQGLASLWQKPQCQLKCIFFPGVIEWPKRWHNLGCWDIAGMTFIWTVMAHGRECLCVQCWSHKWTRLNMKLNHGSLSVW